MSTTREPRLLYCLLSVVALLVLLPLVTMVVTSLKSEPELAQNSWPFWVQGPTLAAYERVIEKTPFGRWVLNSLVVAAAQTLGTVLIALLAAYAFARFRFPGRDALFLVVLATLMVPAQAIMVPSYVIVAWLDWVNTYQGLIVPHLASAFAIFLLRQFFQTVPPELADAAALDGAGHLAILRHVYLPLSTPAVTALAAIVFVQSWNDYYWPLVVVRDNALRTLPLAVVWFRDAERGVEWGAIMAAASLACLPALLLYLTLQRHFVEGFTTSGLKG